MARRRIGFVTTIVLVILAAVATVAVAATRTASTPATVAPPFAADSPFNTPISAGAQVDPASDAMIAQAARDGSLHASMVEFGIPIFSADADTPRYAVPCRVDSWGPCPFDGIQVPIPDDASPHTGSDGAMVVVDAQKGLSYEFWRAERTSNGWTTDFGAVNDLDGSGWGGAATGSGASRLAGVVRISEIEQGEISHALAIQSDNVCADDYRAPAIKTDGSSTRSDCIPEGARVRLDPTLDLDSLDLTPGELVVARAMQRYGAYVVDVGGTSLSVSFELDTSAEPGSVGSVYEQAGLRWDYDGMSAVPWERLQVLK